MSQRRVRGMHDVPTLQGRGRNGRRVGGSREQIAAELARLEHTRMRLAKERELWQRNLVRVEQQLSDTEQRLDLLRQSLLAITETDAEAAAAEADKQTRHPASRRSIPARTIGAWDEVAFEY